MALDGLLVLTVLLGVGVQQLMVVVGKDASNVDVLHEEGDLGKYVVKLLLCDMGQRVGQAGVVELATRVSGSDDVFVKCHRAGGGVGDLSRAGKTSGAFNAKYEHQQLLQRNYGLGVQVGLD